MARDCERCYSPWCKGGCAEELTLHDELCPICDISLLLHTEACTIPSEYTVYINGQQKGVSKDFWRVVRYCTTISHYFPERVGMIYDQNGNPVLAMKSIV
jgi:hypothetical protein